MTDEPLRKEVDALKSDISKLREDIVALTDAVKGVAGDKINETKERGRKTAQDAWEDLEDKLDEVLSRGKDSFDGVAQEIKQHPGGSLLTAFSLGFIIAKIMDIGGRR